jgi:hypothetical protein
MLSNDGASFHTHGLGIYWQYCYCDYAHLSDAALTRYQPIHLQFLIVDVKYARGRWYKVAMLLIAWAWEYAKIRHVALLQCFMMIAT